MCQDAETPDDCRTPQCPYAHSVRVMNAWTTSRNAAASTKGGSDDHYRAGHGPAHNEELALWARYDNDGYERVNGHDASLELPRRQEQYSTHKRM